MDGLRPRGTVGAESARALPWGPDGAICVDPVPGYVGRGALKGRRILLAGGLTGEPRPGQAVAAALGKEGAAVALADDCHRPEIPPVASPLTRRLLRGRPDGTAGLGADRLSATARLLAEFDAPVLPIHCDLASEADCRGAVAHTALEFGGIDALVVCGGGGMSGDALGAITADRLERTFRGNLYSVVWLAQAARTYMADGGAVILSGAAEGRRGSAGHLGYAASAAGVMNLTRSLAAELRTKGIRVNCVVPCSDDDPVDVAAAYAELAAAGSATPTGAVLGVTDILRPRS